MGDLITKELVEKAYTYPEYIRLIEDLLAENKTTGTDQSPDMIDKTRLNLQRMKRITKTCLIDDALKSRIELIRHSMVWLILAEAWCGDGAQAIPYLSAMACLNPFIKLRLILRDEHPEVMEQFLTNGKRVIPKLICLNEDLQAVTSWGPRPSTANEIYLAFKNDPAKSKEEFQKDLHLWYSKDKGAAIMKELKKMLGQCQQNKTQFQQN
jgi:hypothetical protein